MLVFLSAFAIWFLEAGLRTPNYGKLSTTQDGIWVKIRHGGRDGVGVAELCYSQAQLQRKGTGINLLSRLARFDTYADMYLCHELYNSY